MNHSIGKDYTHIGRAENPDYFKETFELHFKKNHVADNDKSSDKDTKNCYAFIAYDGGKIQPLYKNQKNFMMIDTGKTFANLSYK